MVKSGRDYKESWNPEIGKGLKGERGVGGIGYQSLGGSHESRSLLSLINESLAPRSYVIHGAEKVGMQESTITLSMLDSSIKKIIS